MKIVVENSSVEIAQRLAMQNAERAHCQLAANLLRVMRGAGKPNEIASDAIAFINAMVAYREVAGAVPSADELASALDIFHTDPELQSRLSEHEAGHADAQRIIVQGALQIAASQLVEQPAQETMGRGELYERVRLIEKLRE